MKNKIEHIPHASPAENKTMKLRKKWASQTANTVAKVKSVIQFLCWMIMKHWLHGTCRKGASQSL